MSLINLLINQPTEIEMRVALRTEFQLLGINGVIAALKKIGNHDLDTQVDLYEDLMQEDNDEMRDLIAKNSNIKDMSGVTYPLSQTLSCSLTFHSLLLFFFIFSTFLFSPLTSYRDYEILVATLKENAEANGMGEVFKAILRSLLVLPLNTPRGYYASTLPPCHISLI